MKIYRILIAGAGIGGLSAASCLMKAGHHVEIHEQAPELAEVGAGIQVSANAMHVLRHLGLEEAITAVGVRPEAYVFRLHDTGEVIQRFSLSQEELHGAPGGVAGVGRGRRTKHLRAHHRFQPIGADQQVATRGAAVGKAEFDAVGALGKTGHLVIEPNHVWIELAGSCSQQVMQIGTVELGGRRAVQFLLRQ